MYGMWKRYEQYNAFMKLHMPSGESVFVIRVGMWIGL